MDGTKISAYGVMGAGGEFAPLFLGREGLWLNAGFYGLQGGL